jgi:hypothetical protein
LPAIVLPPLYVKLAKPKDVSKKKQNKKLIEMKRRQEVKEGEKN